MKIFSLFLTLLLVSCNNSTVNTMSSYKGVDVVSISDTNGAKALSYSVSYALDENNRLLFFYSGHGYSRLNGSKGYIVPVDAPNPNFDDKGFVRKAIAMNKIVAWAEDIESKHALFLFDSCFSGTV
ncbi:caspase family protein [Candidatus Marithrix sp. Canyon 246]|uniref:caspase family protein n=1 Tax=Candidatus Marithrix sp. Canyon 246 TaxID=1827136 RepID=UPI000849FA47|nr:caspase family protein [Candidatus Marithrix sp. Canyon 246]